jgi:hypothetical protein
VCLSLLAALVLGASPSLFAQGAGSISGTVVDSADGAIPGATVNVKNESGASFDAITNGEGLFNIPAVGAGNYTVTATLTGFKTAVIKVSVLPNTPVTAKMVLEVGQISETVNVSSSSELINTQTATRVGDAERGPVEPDADRDAQRAQCGDVSSRDQHPWHESQFHDQRSSRVDGPDHDGRGQQ